MRADLFASVVAGVGFLAGCGRELMLDPRPSPPPGVLTAADSADQVHQYLSVTIDSGNFYATAQFGLTGVTTTVAIPAADTLTVNGTPMQDNSYAGNDGSSVALYGLSGTFSGQVISFDWTHGGTTYTSSVTPVAIPLASPPTTISKSQGYTVAVSGNPGIQSFGAELQQRPANGSWINASLQIKVDGVAQGTTTKPDLSAFANGQANLRFHESGGSQIQSSPGGGNVSFNSNFTYDVTVTD